MNVLRSRKSCRVFPLDPASGHLHTSPPLFPRLECAAQRIPLALPNFPLQDLATPGDPLSRSASMATFPATPTPSAPYIPAISLSDSTSTPVSVLADTSPAKDDWRTSPDSLLQSPPHSPIG